MEANKFDELKQKIIDAGYGEEIVWSESLKPCADPHSFFCEYMWVVLSSGMKNQIARMIEARILAALDKGQPVSSVFGHKGKARAIEYAREHKDELFTIWQGLQKESDHFKLTWLGSLPWVGEITKYHLAKNLGMDIAKPDRHLTRIAAGYGTSAEGLCRKLADQTGLRSATVDLVIWRAANLGYV